MEKRFYYIAIFFLVLGACVSSEKTSDQGTILTEQKAITVEELTASSNTTDLEKITGNLNYSGNEPFVIPTLFISGDSSFKLMGNDHFINNIFPEINGEKASLYGKIIEKGRLIYFQVHFYEIIKD